MRLVLACKIQRVAQAIHTPRGHIVKLQILFGYALRIIMETAHVLLFFRWIGEQKQQIIRVGEPGKRRAQPEQNKMKKLYRHKALTVILYAIVAEAVKNERAGFMRNAPCKHGFKHALGRKTQHMLALAAEVKTGRGIVQRIRCWLKARPCANQHLVIFRFGSGT